MEPVQLTQIGNDIHGIMVEYSEGKLDEKNMEFIQKYVKELLNEKKNLECKVEKLLNEKKNLECKVEEVTEAFIQRKFTEGYCYKSNDGTIINVIERMEYDPVKKTGKLKVKDMATNEENIVLFTQHLSDAYDCGDWVETIVVRELINYNGKVIVSSNATAQKQVNLRKRKLQDDDSDDEADCYKNHSKKDDTSYTLANPAYWGCSNDPADYSANINI